MHAKKYLFLSLAIISLFSYGFLVFAAAPSGGYMPGATLDPDCNPGDTSPEPCIVQLPLTTADNGLTATGSNIQLGGTLTQNTAIDQDEKSFSLINTAPSGLTNLFRTDNDGTMMRLSDGGNAQASIQIYDSQGGNTSPKLNIFSSGRIDPVTAISDGLTSININPAHYSIQTNGTIDGVTSYAYDFSMNYEKGIAFGNTSSGGNFYYFPRTDGTSGQVLATNGSGQLAWTTVSGGGSGWGLTGNTGTTAGTNFIGTTDAQDLVFKTNGAEMGRLGQIGNAAFGLSASATGENSFAFGENSDAQGDNSVAFRGSTAIGESSFARRTFAEAEEFPDADRV